MQFIMVSVERNFICNNEISFKFRIELMCMGVNLSPCLFCEFIVIRANRKVTNPLLRTFLFPMKLGVHSKTSSFFFTTHSRFAFILFCFFAVSSALAR